jgi:hypothetical protein
MTNKEDDYEIGYRRPPRETRFKKGQSGNPKGRRKKKPASFAEAFGEENRGIGFRCFPLSSGQNLRNESLYGFP